ncbi:ATP-grasp domain-containing protein [Oceanicaulis sp.]|uniref:ATP-grasp domain-containing protein n=1 Tax=Oceanicaulis sp. TaxID=1924941 RepID=UPI003BAAA527
MTRICFLTSADMMKDRPGARDDWFEFDLEFGALSKACEANGISLEACVWDQPFDASVYDGFMVGTVWDYPPKLQLFLDTLDRLHEIAPVYNSPTLVRWNIEKTYLKALDEAGAPSIPTLWADKADADAVQAGFDRFGGDKIVVKPLVGGGAWRQALIKKGEALPAADDLPLGACLIQPFLPGVPEEGEYSMIFFGGRFSHALNKRPKSGDYRVQSLYGASEMLWEPSDADLALAREVLSAARKITGEDEFLYARVDMVRGQDGGLVVMELEIIEPYLYPEQGPDMGAVFVEALKEKLA